MHHCTFPFFNFSLKENNTWLLKHTATGIELSSYFPEIVSRRMDIKEK